jgi:hypothetical protein
MGEKDAEASKEEPFPTGAETGMQISIEEKKAVATTDNTSTTAANNKNLLEIDNISPSDRGWRFWSSIAGLLVTGLLSAVEATVVSTSLPTIVHDLDVGNSYAWIVNAYFLTWYHLLPYSFPFSGPLSD